MNQLETKESFFLLTFSLPACQNDLKDWSKKPSTLLSSTSSVFSINYQHRKIVAFPLPSVSSGDICSYCCAPRASPCPHGSRTKGVGGTCWWKWEEENRTGTRGWVGGSPGMQHEQIKTGLRLLVVPDWCVPVGFMHWAYIEQQISHTIPKCPHLKLLGDITSCFVVVLGGCF